MKVRILFFGSLAEKTGTDGIILYDKAFSNDAVSEAKRQFNVLIESTFSIALNMQIIRSNTALKDNDEIALLPPYAGG